MFSVLESFQHCYLFIVFCTYGFGPSYHFTQFSLIISFNHRCSISMYQLIFTAYYLSTLFLSRGPSLDLVADVLLVTRILCQLV